MELHPQKTPLKRYRRGGEAGSSQSPAACTIPWPWIMTPGTLGYGVIIPMRNSGTEARVATVQRRPIIGPATTFRRLPQEPLTASQLITLGMFGPGDIMITGSWETIARPQDPP